MTDITLVMWRRNFIQYMVEDVIHKKTLNILLDLSGKFTE